ncbi:hypothetical protein [Haladaptatus sp. NG-WS-4]
MSGGRLRRLPAVRLPACGRREGPDSVHVLNAVSPGLTSSLPFGECIAETALDAYE